MYIKKKKFLCFILIPILLITLSVYYKVQSVPKTIFLREGECLKFDNILKAKNKDEIKANKDVYNSYKKIKLNLFGILPVKSIFLHSVSNDIKIYPGGQPVGVKLNTKGVLVIALSDIRTSKGNVSPAALGGIQVGDNITKIDGTYVKNAEQVQSAVNNCSGNKIRITIERKGNISEKIVNPVKGEDNNKYKIGLWVRDCAAGVGTLTFYDNKTGIFAALGHPITDIDTGTIMNISYGEVIPSSIISIKKGSKGNPGELKGVFVEEQKVLGKISKNTECGIFGNGDKRLINEGSKPMKIALRDEIKEGPAKILTTVEGDKPKLYDIRIEKLLQQDSPGAKSMLIRVTDPKLLNKTGGIVQGMSGSPIIQNNKIVGAVTHVLINKPDVGYGIYIEWMLNDSNILSR
ncbi:SpoIVB peptidase [Clostridium fermenticellae]|uniref:SpoIVB peptidase n=1 Tax=Clostridium fermenticellae TaxID=2068654 RepID=A0A386H4X4_9CLOT|nr:SpoIVB peptidase [Clostridium fermenticellae]AYD40583.1 SpoIVB peptidase [Clostridium fermenticellae]